jgi:hypothetical protein
VRTPLPIAASIAQRPGYGGHAWAFLQYLFGFRALGYEPVLVDRLDAEMASGERREAAVRWFRSVMAFGKLDGCWSLLLDDGQTLGLGRKELRERIVAAPCLINTMGFLTDPELLEAADRLVFLDVDPGFPQLWRELGQADLLAGHHRFVTVGANVGRAGCEIPTCGREWIAIRPPVVLDRWPAVATDSRTFSGIGSWRGPYDPIEADGRRFGLRAHEARKLAELPRRSDAEFRFALDVHPADQGDVDRLEANGWQLLDPRTVAASPVAYGEYVRSSGAEIGIAKGIYVETRSGWFSDRSACFLASARPVLCQDTGWRGSLPDSEGLIGFATLDEAVAGAGEIVSDWSRHSRAAREIAEDRFDATKVLGGLLAELGVA